MNISAHGLNLIFQEEDAPVDWTGVRLHLTALFFDKIDISPDMTTADIWEALKPFSSEALVRDVLGWLECLKIRSEGPAQHQELRGSADTRMQLHLQHGDGVLLIFLARLVLNSKRLCRILGIQHQCSFYSPNAELRREP